MKKPQMIIFDYGQTLVKEKGFDGLAGSRAVMRYAVENKYNFRRSSFRRKPML